MVSKKLFDTLTIVLHLFSMIFGIVALAFISCAVAKVDMEVIGEYLRNGNDTMCKITEYEFVSALNLGEIFPTTIKACCFGLGAIVTSFAGNIMGVIGNVDRKGNR